MYKFISVGGHMPKYSMNIFVTTMMMYCWWPSTTNFLNGRTQGNPLLRCSATAVSGTPASGGAKGIPQIFQLFVRVLVGEWLKRIGRSSTDLFIPRTIGSNRL